MTTVQEFLALTAQVVNANNNVVYKHNTPRIYCMDGTSLSVQASKLTYCNPREDIGPYTQVEVGYPSRFFEELLDYAEEPSNPTKTVYGYVPINLVEEIVNKCGGICMEVTLLKKV